MAKKEDLNLGKGDDAEESGGGKGRLIIMIVAALVLFAGGGGATFFLLSGDDEEVAEAEEPAEVEVPDEPLYLDMKRILVNIEHEGRTRYVQVEMQLMSYDQEVIDQAFRDRPAIRDRLIILLNGQDFEALKTVAGKEALRAATLNTVNKTLGLTPPKVVEEVYFENFVIQ